MNKRRERKIGDGLGEFRDGDCLRIGMLDSKLPHHLQQVLHDYTKQAVKISDGSGSRLSLSKPGFRMHTALDQRRSLADQKELDYCEYEDYLSTQYRDVSTPPNSTEPGWLQNNKSELAEGQACTCRNAEFPLNVGDPGTMRWYKGKLCCVPNTVSTDAADAPDHYEQYDDYVTNAWKDAGRKRKPDPEEEVKDDEEETDSDEDGDETLGEAFEQGAIEAAFQQIQTHTESTNVDAIKRDTQAKLNQHRSRMQGIYDQLDFETANAWRKGK